MRTVVKPRGPYWPVAVTWQAAQPLLAGSGSIKGKCSDDKRISSNKRSRSAHRLTALSFRLPKQETKTNESIFVPLSLILLLFSIILTIFLFILSRKAFRRQPFVQHELITSMGNRLFFGGRRYPWSWDFAITQYGKRSENIRSYNGAQHVRQNEVIWQ